MKKIISLLLAVIMVAGLFPTMAFAIVPVTLGNNGYPYAESGLDEDGNNIVTLSPVIASGTTENYQWEYCDTKEGTYALIGGAISESITISDTAYDEKWIKCVVNNGATETKPVQIIKPANNVSKGGATFTDSNGKWYVSNGTMIYNYVPDEKSFDVQGKYTTGGKTYWMGATFYSKWRISVSSEEQSPIPKKYNKSSEDKLSTLYVNFVDEHKVDIKAVLADGQKHFAFGDDLKLGDSYLGAGVADGAAIRATLKEDGKNLDKIQIVGVTDFNDVQNDTAAFVLEPVTPTDCFAIGDYDDDDDEIIHVNKFAKVILNEPSSVGYITTLTEDGNVVTELQNKDSVMALSWIGHNPGDAIEFTMALGTVGETMEEEEEEPEEPEHRSYTTITIGGNKDKEETKAEETVEENPDTGAPVMSFGAVAVILGAAYVLSKKH